jgi:hypothetical protein
MKVRLKAMVSGYRVTEYKSLPTQDHYDQAKAQAMALEDKARHDGRFVEFFDDNGASLEFIPITKKGYTTLQKRWKLRWDKDKTPVL